MLKEIQSKIATFVGDIWVCKKIVGLWPYPLVAYGAYRTSTRGNDYRLFAAMLKPGDMIITTQNKYKGSNSAIPGTFKHLMVYTGTVFGYYKNEVIERPDFYGVDHRVDFNEYYPNKFVRTITHAESEGVITQDLLDVFHYYDEMVVIRPWETKGQQDKIVRTALSFNGRPYDFLFDAERDESLYCTEVGAACLRVAGIELPETIMKMTKVWKPWEKVRVFVADFFAEKFKVVCKTMSCNNPSVFKGPLAKTLKSKLMNCLDASNSSKEYQCPS